MLSCLSGTVDWECPSGATSVGRVSTEPAPTPVPAPRSTDDAAVLTRSRAELAAEQADDVAARCQQVDALVLECSEQLHPLSSQIEALRGDLDSVSFRIALARLHNLAAGIFALQIIEGQDEVDANDAVGSLTELCSALSDGAQPPCQNSQENLKILCAGRGLGW